MKTKQIPALLALAAGFITCIVSFLTQVSMAVFVRNLCLVVVGFLFLGGIIRFVLDKNLPEEEKEPAEVTGQEENTTQQEGFEKENTEKEDE